MSAGRRLGCNRCVGVGAHGCRSAWAFGRLVSPRPMRLLVVAGHAAFTRLNDLAEPHPGIFEMAIRQRDVGVHFGVLSGRCLLTAEGRVLVQGVDRVSNPQDFGAQVVTLVFDILFHSFAVVAPEPYGAANGSGRTPFANSTSLAAAIADLRVRRIQVALDLVAPRRPAGTV